MIEIQTKQNTAKVFTDNLDKPTKQQIAATARDPAYADAKIRVMPDTHAGRGCVIGLTMTLRGRVSPSLVGVDVGCGMEVVKLRNRDVDLPRWTPSFIPIFLRESASTRSSRLPPRIFRCKTCAVFRLFHRLRRSAF